MTKVTSILALSYEKKNGGEVRKITAIGRCLWTFAVVALFAVPVINQYRVYRSIKSEVMGRGILSYSEDNTIKGAYLATEIGDGLIVSVDSSKTCSNAYREYANKQYEQWKDLSFRQYLWKFYGNSEKASVIAQNQEHTKFSEGSQNDGLLENEELSKKIVD